MMSEMETENKEIQFHFQFSDMINPFTNSHSVEYKLNKKDFEIDFKTFCECDDHCSFLIISHALIQSQTNEFWPVCVERSVMMKEDFTRTSYTLPTSCQLFTYSKSI